MVGAVLWDNCNRTNGDSNKLSKLKKPVDARKCG
jgi:hypothetical protein